MTFVSADGLCRSNDAQAVASWDAGGVRLEQQQVSASSRLRALGAKAEHPDDGWVNRETNRVHFCYPRFDEGVSLGDLIALGWPWKGYRIVRCIRIEHSLFGMTYYYFDPAPVASLPPEPEEPKP